MRLRMTLTAGALGLALATGAWAQPQDLTGTIAHVDPAGRIVHFTDGRIAHLEPGATLWVNGRPITFDAVRPGMNVVVRSADTGAARSGTTAGAPGAVTVQPGSRLLTNHPPIDASGTVASVDADNGIVTFQDGRVLQMSPSGYVWEARRLRGVSPGDQVFVQDARPLAFTPPPGTAVSAQGRQVMGTVTRVEAGKAQLVLDDGRIVNIRPTTKMHAGDRTITLSDLQPGDQLVIWVQEPAASSTGAAMTQPRATVTRPGATVTIEPRSDAPSALPREVVVPGFARGSLEAAEVLIMRRPQSP